MIGYQSSGAEEMSRLPFLPLIDPVFEAALVNVTESIEFLEVLQLCSHAVIGWLDAPSGFFGLRSIQMASI